LGDVRNAIGSGGSSVTLRAGEDLQLSFSPGTAPAGQVRDLYLQVRGTYTALASSSREVSTEIVPSPSREPILMGAYPSPTAGQARIGFTLPQRASVSIRVYDVSGRLARKLLDEVRDEGAHEVAWDGRDETGRRIPGGVYFYRMVVGEWRSERRIVLLER
jgi:hypothetical protein